MARGKDDGGLSGGRVIRQTSTLPLTTARSWTARSTRKERAPKTEGKRESGTKWFSSSWRCTLLTVKVLETNDDERVHMEVGQRWAWTWTLVDERREIAMVVGLVASGEEC